MFEYLVIREGNPKKLEVKLNDLGREGWRVQTAAFVASVTTEYVLVREIDSA